MGDTANKIKSLIEQSEKIVITSHKSPDGDSVGSSAGLYHYLKKLGKTPVICHPDEAPEFISWAIPSIKLLDQSAEEVSALIHEADLLFALDYNDPTRMGNDMAELFVASSAKKVMIDHHLFPKDFTDLSISRPDVCSTSQLIFEFIEQVEGVQFMDSTICTPLYLGIMTDTGSFRFSSVTPKTHEIIADMIRLGVDQGSIHERVYDNIPLRRIQIRSYAIAEKLEIMESYGVAIVSLTKEEFERFNHQKGDTEGLVNHALAIEGVRAAVFLRELDDSVRLSFRSRSEYPVNELAMREFEGGGHKNAAGGIWYGSIQEAIENLKVKVPNYFETKD